MTIELLEKLMSRPEVQKRLADLHKGYGTATEERIYLDLEAHLADLRAQAAKIVEAPNA